ncbi:hypothetical protein GCM10010218_14300 [Streptomyces mashuensis]|uniref:Penicillin-binding protein transpeptidase domain-containing protein n=1 Tax=Streptomyces mashuensis TaxID=33904 RepID=A0A919EBL6_9ACTN|nr:penicillin-binding transpeptidase domain-containing protein [Streptomyces mashuensis]GHF34290.1 hypothetical protein GCM10010218_14300 [Streptomyces mashuensis]
MVVVAAALEKGVYASVDAPAHGGEGACEHVSVRQALAQGCDEVFAVMEAEVGREAVRTTAEAFGFEEAGLRVPVPVAKSTYGPEGATATPLQMARVMAVVGNGGRQVGPRLVDRVVHADGSVEKPPPATSTGRQAVTPHTAEQLASVLNAGTLTSSTDKGTWSLALTRGKDGRLLAVAVRTDDAAADATARTVTGLTAG